MTNSEDTITLIIGGSMFMLLLVVSIYNIFFGKKNNLHLQTYNEDVELYSYKQPNNKIENVIATIPDTIKQNDVVIDNSESVAVIDTQNSDKNIKKIDASLKYYNIHGDINLYEYGNWDDLRTSFRKDLVIHKTSEINSRYSSYTGYFCIRNLTTNSIIKERYIKSTHNSEEVNIPRIKTFATTDNNAIYELLYIGSFGFIITRITEILDLI